MVEAVMLVRHAAQEKETTVIVAPLQQLNESHLAIRRMVSGGKMLFVDDDKWRKENLPEKLKLPRFVQIAGKQAVEVAK
jgi:hypothetical protein